MPANGRRCDPSGRKTPCPPSFYGRSAFLKGFARRIAARCPAAPSPTGKPTPRMEAQSIVSGGRGLRTWRGEAAKPTPGRNSSRASAILDRSAMNPAQPRGRNPACILCARPSVSEAGCGALLSARAVFAGIFIYHSSFNGMLERTWAASAVQSRNPMSRP
jgi:hypothetical protein